MIGSKKAFVGTILDIANRYVARMYNVDKVQPLKSYTIGVDNQHPWIDVLEDEVEMEKVPEANDVLKGLL